MNITLGYNPEDIDRLYELEKVSFSRAFRWRREDLVEALGMDDIWILRKETKIVGYVLVEEEDDEGHVISLTVDPAYRRQGFGKTLMDAAETYYKYKKKLKKMVLEVHVENPAQLLYFNLGYRATGFKGGYYANGSNAIVMTKILRR